MGKVSLCVRERASTQNTSGPPPYVTCVTLRRHIYIHINPGWLYFCYVCFLLKILASKKGCVSAYLGNFPVVYVFKELIRQRIPRGYKIAAIWQGPELAPVMFDALEK